MISIFSLILSSALAAPNDAATEPDADDNKEAAGARLQFMKESAAKYDIRLNGEKKSKLNLVAEPVLRWNNPVSSVPDGSLFIWCGPDGRPELAAQVFIAAGTKDLWLHEFQSLSLDTFTVSRGGAAQWNPKKPGMELAPIEGAPPPAETAVQRLSQMRKIAADFEAADDFEGASRWELRLLPKPLKRYGNPDTELLDGALFAFVHGTDPEVFLMLEARGAPEKRRWHYGLAPMTAYALKVSYKDRPIWSTKWRKPPFDPDEPFYILQYAP